MEVPDSLTVVEQIYHQSPNEQPLQIESRYSRALKTREQVYQRRLKANEHFYPLDLGWFNDRPIGLIVISNLEGLFPQTIPTPEELEETSKKVLEIYSSEVDGCKWLIPPGETMRGLPSPPNLRIRSQYGTVRYVLYVFPE